ncbi:P-loop containing nucleoside triphosphate hydrolase protein [Trichoderma sp. SZMC 28013]
MLKKSIDAKVRPLANVSLERASLLGAARIYVSKDSLISLTGGLESGRPCTVESLQTDDTSGDGSAADAETSKRRGASLWVLPEKNISPNVVMMTRAFQEATGFKLGDMVRITLAEPAVIPDAEEVVVQDAASEADQQKDAAADSKHPPSWEFSVSVSLDRAEQVFPGMVLEGVNINKLRRTFKVISVNGQANNLARFKLSSSTVRILQPGGDKDTPEDAQVATTSGPLAVTGVPGLSSQVNTINQFLRGFGRPFWIQNERESCGFVIHGGHGTGKTFILQRIAATNWGRIHWIRPSDKLSSIRETFKQAQSQQPSLLFIDGLEDILAKDRSNRDTVIEALGDELDNLSAAASTANALPRVVVIATCLDYLADVPAKLQKRSRFRENVALPIPRATERLEILRFFNPPLQAEEKDSCLVSLASKTHAYNGDDLANLVLNAKKILGNRLDEETAAAHNIDVGATEEISQETQQPKEHYLTSQDMEQALRITRPTAMHDINLKPPTIHWQDVGGQESLKKVLSRMIKNTKDTNPTSRHVLRQPPKGLLLYGPPGCSKTLSAQAMATESSFNFFAVKGAELLNMYVGESERAVRTLFERARAAAPSIIFFDEIDSIGGSRTGGNGAAAAARSTGSVNMLTTLLTEMDGFESLTGVLVLAATNRPEAMDPALLRPGRFDQILYVGPPDLSAREAVFGVHLRGLALSPDVDIPELARVTDGYSGAEIKAICNEAGLAVLDRCDEDETGTEKMEITMADLVAAVEKTPRNITAMMISGYEMWSRQFKRL